MEQFNIEHYPALVILDANLNNRGIRFYGIPSGYEVHSLIASIKEASGIEDNTKPEIIEKINKIDKPVHIQVFVTPTCPYCPAAVINGHKLAYMNSNVICDMIEATSFPEISEKYGVRGVPKIVINETHDLTGSQPIEKYLEIIDKL
ncbi:MAG: thioredoxin family protein [Saprospiraceae bacterium]